MEMVIAFFFGFAAGYVVRQVKANRSYGTGSGDSKHKPDARN